MSHETPLNQQFSAFVDQHMRQGSRVVPARLQAAMALLERIRDFPTLDLEEHKKKGSSGLISHETFGDRAHARFGLEPINKNHGRRSSDLANWGPLLLDLIRATGFLKATPAERKTTLDQAQQLLVAPLKAILEQEPIEVRIRRRTGPAVVADLLRQADAKGKAGDVAQYLVGAKLVLRLNVKIEPHQANRKDRKYRSDPDSKLGDFAIEDAIIEVALGLPDDSHLDKIADALESGDTEVWLLTRSDRVATWQTEIAQIPGIDLNRVFVTSVEAFVGQNVTEIGGFAARGKALSLKELFDIYNTHWVKRLKMPGIQIVTRK